jgi:hypothetical protein
VNAGWYRTNTPNEGTLYYRDGTGRWFLDPGDDRDLIPLADPDAGIFSPAGMDAGAARAELIPVTRCPYCKGGHQVLPPVSGNEPEPTVFAAVPDAELDVLRGRLLHATDRVNDRYPHGHPDRKLYGDTVAVAWEAAVESDLRDDEHLITGEDTR